MGSWSLSRAVKSSTWVRSGYRRWFTCSSQISSGHNRWSKIRHDKGREDALKSKARTLLSQEVILASKLGGPDPALNSRLVTAIASAKRGQLSKSSIDAAIAKGQGKSVTGAPLESITIEAMLPHGVAALIECQTESKGRVLQDVRLKINRSGGSVTPTAFMFEKRGKIWFAKRDDTTVDDILDEAIDAGALEVELDDEGRVVVETEPHALTTVANRLAEKYRLTMERSELLYAPREDSMVSLSETEAVDIGNIMEALEDEPSLQNVYLTAA